MSKIQQALHRIKQPDVHKPDLPKTPPDAAALPANDPANEVIQVSIDALESVSLGHRLELNREALRNAGLVAHREVEEPIARQFREIARPLVASYSGPPPLRIQDGNLIMISSAIAGEGKSFVSTNLAIAIVEEYGLPAILVDFNSTSPTITEAFGAQGEPGLLDLLHGAVDSAESVVCPTDTPGLSIVPAGQSQPPEAGSFPKYTIKRTIDSLANFSQGQAIVLDTPAFANGKDLQSVTEIVGQIVFVVCALHTHCREIEAALEKIDRRKAVSFMLNKLPAKW